MLHIDQVSFRAGQKVLLKNASLSINTKERIAIVGQNGVGKTSLLNLIRGHLQPDSGKISVPKNICIAMTNQEAPSEQITPLEFVLRSKNELFALQQEAKTATDPQRIAEVHEKLINLESSRSVPKAAKILAGLGFTYNMQQQSCKSLSGGWKMRVGMASLLFSEPDMLLLDEPTNHLDLESTIWLTNYLRNYRGTIILVSHDRDLLNSLPKRIIHIENNQLKSYSGNYEQFAKARKQQIKQVHAVKRKQDAEKKKIITFVERFRSKATKAKQAQSRLKLLEKMEPISEFPDEERRIFEFPEPKHLPPPLYNLSKVYAGYKKTIVLKNISLRLDADDRIALLGPNGNGKSTFIKLLAGEIQATSGMLSKSPKLKIGYFDQHQSTLLDASETPFTEMKKRIADQTSEKTRTHLGHFGFSQERADVKIGSLSGGEKARLLFALMSAEKPNVLLLDEPTNHLDIESREALAQAINAFTGAVVIVSHDTSIIEMVADRLWLVSDGGITQLDGDLNDYRQGILLKPKTKQGTGKIDHNKVSCKTKNSNSDRSTVQKQIRLQINKCENEIRKLEQNVDLIRKELINPDFLNNSVNTVKAHKTLHALEIDLQKQFNIWDTLVEQLDTKRQET